MSAGFGEGHQRTSGKSPHTLWALELTRIVVGTHPPLNRPPPHEEWCCLLGLRNSGAIGPGTSFHLGGSLALHRWQTQARLLLRCSRCRSSWALQGRILPERQ